MNPVAARASSDNKPVSYSVIAEGFELKMNDEQRKQYQDHVDEADIGLEGETVSPVCF
jgi:hypothetical protein